MPRGKWVYQFIVPRGQIPPNDKKVRIFQCAQCSGWYSQHALRDHWCTWSELARPYRRFGMAGQCGWCKVERCLHD